MTFGSILAATDPVAVAVLLNELGAPPRLKMHVSGESLMNDGSAVVFYHIFSLRFFYEMGIPGIGENVDWAEGFALFFRLSLGGACIGVAFGIGLLVILYNLNRRLSGEDSVIQVVATISTAYLVFFTSEILAGCSGIIAVLFCGVTTKAFGETFYNDSHLSVHFWKITESLLNTLLFTLGGCVWGDIMSTEAYTGDALFVFSAKDWVSVFLDMCSGLCVLLSGVTSLTNYLSFIGVFVYAVCLCDSNTLLLSICILSMYISNWDWTKCKRGNLHQLWGPARRSWSCSCLVPTC